MKPSYVWKDVKVYIKHSKDLLCDGESMISQLITKDQSRIKTNEYGKPYLIDNAFYFNISHTAGYVALAISDKRDIGIDIEQVHRQVDYKLILFSRRNIQYINSIGNSEEFIREWTIRESAIKCYGDLTLNSIYQIKNKNHILVCESKPDLEYHVFKYKDAYVCISAKL